MIVRQLEDVQGTDRDVEAPTFRSRRLLLAEDGMGFSFHDTVLFAGSETYIWYKHHLEAVYCMGGTGELEEVGSGEVHPIRPGTFYALDGHEKHYLRATTDLRMMCVFSPALTGAEVHDDEGAYPLLTGQEKRPPPPDDAPGMTKPGRLLGVARRAEEPTENRHRGDPTP